MMICPYCNNQFKDGTQVCSQCGAPLVPVQQQVQYMGNNIQPQSSKKKGCLIAVAIFFLLGAFGSCFGNGTSHTDSSTSETKQTTAAPKTTTAKTTKATEKQKAEETKTTTTEVVVDIQATALFEDVFAPYEQYVGKLDFKDFDINSEPVYQKYTVKTPEQNADDFFWTYEFTDENGDCVDYCFSVINYDDTLDDMSQKRMLYLISYTRGEKSIEIYTENGVIIHNTHDKTRESPNVEVRSLTDQKKFMFSDEDVKIEKFDAKEEAVSGIKDKVRECVKDYSDTSITDIKINPDAGTDVEGDYVVLVYLKYDVNNSQETTKKMLDMYSSDMAARLGKDVPEVQEVAIFWTVPYLNNGTAKISFERSGDNMKYTDKVFALG